MKAWKWVMVGLWLLGLEGWAAIRYVDVNAVSPQPPYTNWSMAASTIQAAIDSSLKGDTVLVAPGVYILTGNPVSIPLTNSIYLKSTQSRAAIIDAQHLSSCVSLLGTNSVLEGFTLRHGWHASYGGGVAMYRPATVRDCLIVSNEASGGAGIALYTTGLVENCTVEDNHASSVGGGVLFYYTDGGLVRNCVIRDNTSGDSGAGVAIYTAGTVDRCLVYSNHSVAYGGGVNMDGGVLCNSILYGNYAGSMGGGVYAGGSGGARILHCTIVSNSASTNAGGAILYNNSSCWNSIIQGNNARTNSNLFLEDSTASNCCVTPSPSASNFTNDPAFLNAAGHDYRLNAGSPCVDAGCASNAMAYDVNSLFRPENGSISTVLRYDVGAHEYALHFKPELSISNNTATLRWDMVNRGGYTLEAATNAVNPFWFRLTGTNWWMGDNPSVQTQSVILNGPGLMFRVRAEHSFF